MPRFNRAFVFVYSFRRSEQNCSPLLKVVRGAVELVWHPLLFGFFRVTDSLALVVLWSLRHAPRRHCLKNKKNIQRVESKNLDRTNRRTVGQAGYWRAHKNVAFSRAANGAWMQWRQQQMNWVKND